MFEEALSRVPSVGGSAVLLEGAAVTSSLTASALSSMLQLLLLLLTGSLLLSSLSLLLSGLSGTPVGACCSVWSMSVASSWEPQGTSLSARSASGPEHSSAWVLLDGSAGRRNEGRYCRRSVCVHNNRNLVSFPERGGGSGGGFQVTDHPPGPRS